MGAWLIPREIWHFVMIMGAGGYSRLLLRAFCCKESSDW